MTTQLTPITTGNAALSEASSLQASAKELLDSLKGMLNEDDILQKYELLARTCLSFKECLDRIYMLQNLIARNQARKEEMSREVEDLKSHFSDDDLSQFTELNARRDEQQGILDQLRSELYHIQKNIDVIHGQKDEFNRQKDILEKLETDIEHNEEILRALNLEAEKLKSKCEQLDSGEIEARVLEQTKRMHEQADKIRRSLQSFDAIVRRLTNVPGNNYQADAFDELVKNIDDGAQAEKPLSSPPEKAGSSPAARPAALPRRPPFPNIDPGQNF